MSLCDDIKLQNMVDWFWHGDKMNQPYFCYHLNGFTLGNNDCVSCGRCKKDGGGA